MGDENDGVPSHRSPDAILEDGAAHMSIHCTKRIIQQKDLWGVSFHIHDNVSRDLLPIYSSNL